MKVHQIFSIVVMVTTLPSSVLADGNLRLGGTASSNTEEGGGGKESILSSEAMVQIQSLLEVAPEIADSFMMSDNDERMEMVQEASDQVKNFVESERGVMMREELMKSEDPQEALQVLSSMLVVELSKMLEDSGFRRLEGNAEDVALLTRLTGLVQIAVPLILSARENVIDIQDAFALYQTDPNPNGAAPLASFLQSVFRAASEFCSALADVLNGGSVGELRRLQAWEDEGSRLVATLINVAKNVVPIWIELLSTRDEVHGAFAEYELEQTNANLAEGMADAFLAVSDFFGEVADAFSVPEPDFN